MRFRFSTSMLLGAAALLTGCGKSGPPRYGISGKVTLEGKPVPAGTITFEPNSLQDAKGMSATGVIANGEYSIPAEVGATGGAYLVRIAPPALESGGATPPPGSQFKVQSKAIQLPKETSQQDVNFDNAVQSGGPASSGPVSG